MGDNMQQLKVIELNNISKIYRSPAHTVTALNNVSLSVISGEMVGIVGASGSGKSTLMNIIGCLDTPSSGTYRLFGKDLLGLKDKHRSIIRCKNIGFIFQSFNLIPTLSALENVQLPLFYAGVKKKERLALAEIALIKVWLKDRLHHRPHQLSGGQQQRVSVARALVNSPELILADEPTGNLDQKASNNITELLYELNADGKTVVIITHDKKIAESLPRTIEISGGKVLSV